MAITWTGFWRAIVRSIRTGADIFIGSLVAVVITNFVQIDQWYILPIASLIAGSFKYLREKYPYSWFWKYLPL